MIIVFTAKVKHPSKIQASHSLRNLIGLIWTPAGKPTLDPCFSGRPDSATTATCYHGQRPNRSPASQLYFGFCHTAVSTVFTTAEHPPCRPAPCYNKLVDGPKKIIQAHISCSCPGMVLIDKFLAVAGFLEAAARCWCEFQAIQNRQRRCYLVPIISQYTPPLWPQSPWTTWSGYLIPSLKQNEQVKMLWKLGLKFIILLNFYSIMSHRL